MTPGTASAPSSPDSIVPSKGRYAVPLGYQQLAVPLDHTKGHRSGHGAESDTSSRRAINPCTPMEEGHSATEGLSLWSVSHCSCG